MAEVEVGLTQVEQPAKDQNVQFKITRAPSGKDYHLRHAQELSTIFLDDPVLRYMCSSLSEPDRIAYMPQYFTVLMRAAMLNSGIFEECNDWSCMTVWMPPGKRIDNELTILQAGFLGSILKLGFGGAKRMLIDFSAQVDKIKKKWKRQLGIREFWYLFFVGTRKAERGKGLASEMIRKWQREVGNVPIWLEATTEGSRDLYLRLGFRELEVLVMGKGTHSKDGVVEKGGEGVRLWAMVWMPERTKV
ncbi:putative N-acetyltransferase [Pseudocercospora fuligena]|uniref:Putative N-acetyltransferase n=1 Tax=Pseudocercospora fuligena TaxID=685502 RepID=A0A8H6RMZ2_9PEZI|nr:putative N-acetyltransferase [Pseudocercospora fuligena]